MGKLNKFDEIILSKQEEIYRLNKNEEQASKATYLGLIAKELYWDFKTELEQFIKEPMIQSYMRQHLDIHNEDKII